MKITNAAINNRKKVILISTKQSDYELPFSKLMLPPTSKNKIKEIYIDKELANEAITYQLTNGEEDSIHLDVFLDYNKDPKFLKKLFLFELTQVAKKELKKSRLSKNEICRRIKTSASQLARLLDQTNDRKSVDKMLELLAVLGVSVRPLIEKVA